MLVSLIGNHIPIGKRDSDGVSRQRESNSGSAVVLGGGNGNLARYD